MHTKAIPNSVVKMIRSDCCFKQIRKDKFVNYMIDMEKNMIDDPLCTDFKVIERGANGIPSLLYFRTKM